MKVSGFCYEMFFHLLTCTSKNKLDFSY